MRPLVSFNLGNSYCSGIRWSIPWCGRSWLKYAVYCLTTCRKCWSSWSRIWSRHSRRRLPINLSQPPFACGVRYSVSNSWMLAPTAEKCLLYLPSRSRIRYLGPFPHGVASRKSIRLMWLGECSFLSFGMYRWMVHLLTSIPNLNNSPWICSAPHNWFSFAIFWIKAIVSGDSFGLPNDFRHQ